MAERPPPRQRRKLLIPGGRQSKQAVLFLKKKEPKKLLPIQRCQRQGTHLATRWNQGEKSFFASFFSKKEDACFLNAPR
jgi:hypothetical protein